YRSIVCHVCTCDGLDECRVRMDCKPYVCGVTSVLHGERDLADQLAGVGAYDAAAQHAVVDGIEQELGEALVASERERAAVRHPRERTLAERGAVGASVGLGEARPRDLRIRVGHRGDRARVERALVPW